MPSGRQEECEAQSHAHQLLNHDLTTAEHRGWRHVSQMNSQCRFLHWHLQDFTRHYCRYLATPAALHESLDEEADAPAPDVGSFRGNSSLGFHRYHYTT